MVTLLSFKQGQEKQKTQSEKPHLIHLLHLIQLIQLLQLWHQMLFKGPKESKIYNQTYLFA